MNTNDKEIKENLKAADRNESIVSAEEMLCLSNRKMNSIKRMIDKKERINADKIRNQEMEIERKILKTARLEYDDFLMANDFAVHKPWNKSQLETIKIIENAAKMGIELTEKEVRKIKKELRIQAKIVHPVQRIKYLNTLGERVGSRGVPIILLAMIKLIKARCPMPRNYRKFQLKAVKLAKAQTDDIFGFFSDPFDGLDQMIEDTGTLFTEIENYEANNGTGSLERVKRAIYEVKLSVAALVVYVNKLCRADQENSLAIIAAAGMIQRKPRAKNTKADFSLKHGATGEIILISLAAKINGKKVTATYYWQYGLMIEGVLTWYDLPDTINQCKTTATGMPKNITVFFRKSVRTKKGGRSKWCKEIGISPR